MGVQSFKVVTLLEFFDEFYKSFQARDVTGDGVDVELNLFELGYRINQATGLFDQDIKGSQLLIKCDHDGLAS